MTMKVDPIYEREWKIKGFTHNYFTKHLDLLQCFFLEFYYVRRRFSPQLPTVRLRIFNKLPTFGMYHPNIREIDLKFRPHAPNKMKDIILHELIHYLIDTLLDEEYSDDHPPEFWMYLKQFKRFIK